ncbi:Zinc finger (C3HC4-type RING finger) family protein [Melia azedarach]|uniref:Zinc finger (C3HC4-type RING finger) family protein n=1 Tax=Melia azedarach TaxID=155640 RepID=A0ACC1WTX2_MELAZ|nr:Zinc finger (C3HC4-type RING finger) family protein [Melia azedarach]
MADTLKKLKKSLSLKLSFQAGSHCPRPCGSDRTHSAAPSSRLSRSLSFQPSKSSRKTCAICLASLRRGQGLAIFTAECSHSFHFSCIAANVQHGNRVCPICRCEWKDIPFQAPTNVIDDRRNNMARARVSPFDATPEDANAAGGRRNFPTALQLPPEPELFTDDELLPVNSVASASPSRAEALTVKAIPEFIAVAAADAPPKFSVLVRICAPSLPNEANHLDRAPIDLVTVLDVSGSMSSKLPLLKRAVNFIIQNLGPGDRLSIVVFSSAARRILPLQRMSDSGREVAIRAVNCLYSNGGTNIVAGLKKGVRVLEERRDRNPVASIILLSDGQDTHNVRAHHQSMQNESSTNLGNELVYLNLLPALICPSNSVSGCESQQSTIPVHTFGFGLEHDSMAMHSIADASGGTFSFIETIGALQDAFARCIGGLLSVVSQDVRLTIRSLSTGVRIGSIPSGSYKNEILDQGQQAVIDIGNLYADEEKEFLICLSIPLSAPAEGKESTESTQLLEVMCAHKDATSMEIHQVEGEKVEIRRPAVVSTADKKVNLEVDRQRNRLLIAETIADAQRMAEIGDLEGAQALLAERRAYLLSSASAQAGDSLCNWLEAELREIRERMASMDLYERTGRAYVLSGLSSHSWQRATTRGVSTTHSSGTVGHSSTSETRSYETPSMSNMVSRSQTLNFALVEQQRHNMDPRSHGLNFVTGEQQQQQQQHK